jgi:hypothetical protein
MKLLLKFLPFVLILIISFFAFKPLLLNGFFPIHDDTQIARVYEMTKALQDGMFPVRWSMDLGYGFGYPLFNYYDPLPYYVASFFDLVGFDALYATKLMVILSVIISGLSMYLLSKEFFGRKGGILSAALYILAPFHAVEIFVRGDFAENFAYAFIPLLFYGIWKISQTFKWKYTVLSAVSFSFIILSHNLTAMMVSPFILLFIIFILLREKKKKFIISIYLLFPLLLGGLISSFYSLPAILEMRFTDVLSQIGGGANFRDHFVCLGQLWTSQWGYGGSAKGCIDGVSFMVGKYHLLLSFVVSFISIILLFSKRYRNRVVDLRENLYLIIFFFILLLISIFLMLSSSQFIWEIVKPMSFFQFPWRFLIMVTFFTSLLSGGLLWFIAKYIKDKNLNYGLFVLIIVCITYVSMKFFVPQVILNRTSNDYTTKAALSWEASRISDEYLPQGFIVPQTYYQIPDVSSLRTSELNVIIVERKTNYIKLNLEVFKPNNYVLPLAYFPAWNAELDGKKVEITQNNRGSVIYFPEGKHTLELRFVETTTERIANLISLAGILVIIVGIIRLRLKK